MLDRRPALLVALVCGLPAAGAVGASFYAEPIAAAADDPNRWP